MSIYLRDLLDDARRERFVGRHREVAAFDDALAARSPARMLFVHGEGGIGKTTLLRQLCARARAAGRPVVQIDGRDIDPSPEGMAVAIRATFDGVRERAAVPGGAARGPHPGTEGTPPGGDDPLARLPAGAVLLIDGYEQLAPIDGWLREEFVPGLSADNLVVLAGRDPPTAPWRADPGWRRLVSVHRLAAFDAAESGRLLAHAGVDPSTRPHLISLGRGHPLTMALLADRAAAGQVPDTLAAAPDLISALLESFLHDAPSDAHLTGLATCAIARLTTEDLLRRLVGADAAVVWQWLARRPFVTTTPHGLFAHDLARDVLDAEFERRAPERYRACHRLIHSHAVAGLRAAGGADREPHAQQLHFLLRCSPLGAAIAALRAQGSAAVVPARRDEHERICAIIERFEGPASAALARDWLSERPDHLSVVRTGEGVAAYSYHVLCPSGSELDERDPVVRAVLDHVARRAPLRAGERVSVARFLGGSREHQRDLYAIMAGNVSSIVEWLSRPLAWSFCVTVDDEYWAPFFDFMAFTRVARIDIGGLRHVAYGIDWRRVPVDTWFGLMRERGHSGGTGPPPEALLRPPPLDRTRFAEALRAALRTLHRPDQLAANPLIGSALAASATGPDAAQLRTTIENAVADLGNEPKGGQLRAVLHRTYLRPAPTQEAAAEVLGLPFSTYRRHLAKAVDHLTDILWAIEVGDQR